MNPISTAIIAAVTAGVTETGRKAVLDAYQGLKGLIQSKFGQDNKVSNPHCAFTSEGGQLSILG